MGVDGGLRLHGDSCHAPTHALIAARLVVLEARFFLAFLFFSPVPLGAPTGRFVGFFGVSFSPVRVPLGCCSALEPGLPGEKFWRPER